VNPQISPFGLQIADPNWLTATGDRAPSQRCVPAFDQSAFAVGDLVHETGAAIGGVAAVSSSLRQLKPDGTSYPYIYPRAGATPLIVVAVAPSGPGMANSPVLPAGVKQSTGLVWVIPAGSAEFFVAGDASTPARGEILGSSEASLNLFASQFETGTLCARLAYGAPIGGVSGTALAGGSFTLGDGSPSDVPGGHGVLQVLGLTQGMALAPRAQYRVRFRSFK
jgi:hypothetical protein